MLSGCLIDLWDSNPHVGKSYDWNELIVEASVSCDAV